MKAITMTEARTVNGGLGITGVEKKSCPICGRTFKARWWFFQSSKNAAIVAVNTNARKCELSHLDEMLDEIL